MINGANNPYFQTNPYIPGHPELAKPSSNHKTCFLGMRSRHDIKTPLLATVQGLNRSQHMKLNWIPYCHPMCWIQDVEIKCTATITSPLD